VPELPEVETIKNDLAEVLVGEQITDVTVRLPKIVKSNPRTFRRDVKGQHIGSLARRGKLLIVELEGSDRYILIHLKMTGQLIYRRGAHVIAGGHSQGIMPIDNLPNAYSHVIFSLADGSQLFFNDLRQFGYIKVVNAQEKEDELSVYGVEPLAEVFTADLLRERLAKRKVAVKSVLLDQSVIAGLGNIYVDEACFYAGVRPTRRADRLTRAEIDKLHTGIQQVIRLAIKHRGTTFNNYRDAHGRTGNFVRRLNVYGRGGEPCRQCGTSITKIKSGGRGTTYCPKCQR
jgi:formamidopyrimidine-DNA glycosylase